MFVDLSQVRVYVKPGPTDMRKQINGLSAIIEADLDHDPFSGSLYVFCNRQRNRLKILYWDRSGFALWFKRLEKNKFPWPKNKDEAIRIDTDQLRMLLSGIDFWHAHERLCYTSVI